MAPDQLRDMAAHGMEIYGHSDRHAWYEDLSPAQQGQDIQRTLQWLTVVHGERPLRWVMSYPYGSYTPVTLRLLRKAGCVVGLTNQPGVVPDFSRPLEMPRLDTIDLPYAGDAQPCAWTRNATRAVAPSPSAGRRHP